MKNLSLILNAVLFVAVGLLYFLHFNKTSQLEETAEETLTEIKAPKASIAYINSDTLLAKYDYFKEMIEKMEVRREKMEQDYANRARGLQNEISNFQQTAQSMTMNQARAKEEELVRKQQNLAQYQENLSRELMQEEAKINEELYSKVSEYISSFGKDQQYQVVLTYSRGSGVLYANDSLDITFPVIDGLNKIYREEKSGGSTVKNEGNTKKESVNTEK